MRLQLTRPLVCLDLETTGLDTSSDRIVEFGAVKLWPDGRRESIEKRCDPGIDVPEQATKIHGIRNDDVRGLFGEPPLSKLGPEFCEFLGDADLTGFNIGADLGGEISGYDLPLWLAEVERHQLPFTMEGRKVVDARLIFVAKEPAWDRFVQGPRNLNNAVLHYLGRNQADAFSQRDSGDGQDLGLSLEEQNRHSAVKDADATLDVLIAQLGRYDDVPTTVDQLASFCTNVAREQQTAAR
ncbi:MAG: 3'-5' exonuclease [Planctomycetota bacterium]